MVARSHGGGAECHFFFFNDTPPPEIYPLSLHAALPIFNRQLRGLLFDPEPPAAPAEGWSAVTHVDRDVGRVTSLASVPETGVAGAGRWIGLALIRREVEPGSVVRASGRDARVVDLPFIFPIAAPA